MAKLGSSSCRPLLQGMLLLLAVLLLASIQAGPVMASGEEALFAQLVDYGGQLVDNWREKLRDLPEDFRDTVGKKILTELDKKTGKDFSNGGKTGIKIHKYYCKAKALMDQQNPGGASGTLLYSYVDQSGDPVCWYAERQEL